MKDWINKIISYIQNCLKGQNNLCLVGVHNNSSYENKNTTYFWSPSFERRPETTYQEDRALKEKNELEEMNGLLSKLENKLGNNKELCQEASRLISVIVETDDLILRFSQTKTTIPIIEFKIEQLIKVCEMNLIRNKDDFTHNIVDILTMLGVEVTREDMDEIENILDYCVSKYSLYEKSAYRNKYCGSDDDSIKTR